MVLEADANLIFLAILFLFQCAVKIYSRLIILKYVYQIYEIEISNEK